jgi:hypothetical protein
MHDDQATGEQPRVPKDFVGKLIASEQRVPVARKHYP